MEHLVAIFGMQVQQVHAIGNVAELYFFIDAAIMHVGFVVIDILSEHIGDLYGYLFINSSTQSAF